LNLSSLDPVTPWTSYAIIIIIESMFCRWTVGRPESWCETPTQPNCSHLRNIVVRFHIISRHMVWEGIVMKDISNRPFFFKEIDL
jgi:hypothetical protein